MTPEQFSKKFHTCSAKFNLIFAYGSASEKTFSVLKLDAFALARNYAEFCYLDMQRILFMLYKTENPDVSEELVQKIDALDEFLTMSLKNLDNLPK